jgi:hypothetical protein
MQQRPNGGFPSFGRASALVQRVGRLFRPNTEFETHELTVTRFIFPHDAVERNAQSLGSERREDDPVAQFDGQGLVVAGVPCLVGSEEQVDLFARALDVDDVGEARGHLLVIPAQLGLARRPVPTGGITDGPRFRRRVCGLGRRCLTHQHFSLDAPDHMSGALKTHQVLRVDRAPGISDAAAVRWGTKTHSSPRPSISSARSEVVEGLGAAAISTPVSSSNNKV